MSTTPPPAQEEHQRRDCAEVMGLPLRCRIAPSMEKMLGSPGGFLSARADMGKDYNGNGVGARGVRP